MNSIEPFFDSVRDLLKTLPKSWVELTTHRLDIYNESEAKSEFLVELKKLLLSEEYSSNTLEQLPRLMITFDWGINCLAYWNGSWLKSIKSQMIK